MIQLIKEEVPKEDEILINQQIKSLEQEIKGITLGEYVDITLDKRFNGGDWEKIPETREDIEIEIEIPETIQFDNTSYFVSRAHNNNTTLLKDLDKDPNIITISSKYFSTYAILYTLEEITQSCYWHSLILLALVIYIVLALSWKRERRKRYLVLLVGDIIIIVMLAIAGTCRLDWPIAIISTAIAILTVPTKKLLSKKEKTESIEG